jgi:nucleoside 2-deoxyribosyltransferase
MTITICASIKFYPQILEVKSLLEDMGYEVLIPPNRVKNDQGESISVLDYYQTRKNDVENKINEEWVWERKQEAIRWHFEKIDKADVILVLNYDKNDIINYIGGNTLMEMGVAFWLNKPIYLYNPIPEGVSYFEEIKGMRPIVINGDLNLIK